VGELRVELSVEVTAAGWIADRLTSPRRGVVTSVVPGEFESYARMLHPLRGSGTEPGRWSDVADWSGVQLVPGGQFPDIALPEHEPVEAEPWPGLVPDVGTLCPLDAVALADVLFAHTTTPSRCWFGVWEGWASSTHAPGPRVRLPWRDYVLFVGPLAALPSLVDSQDGQTPNLWWPDDRAWCVGTEIDLPWTYIGGSAALIKDLLADPRIETQPADPDDDHHLRAPEWLAPTIAQASIELLETGTTTLHTWRGTIRAQLHRPQAQASGDLRIQSTIPDGRRRGSSWTQITEQEPDGLRAIVEGSLTSAVIELL
jgi:hypothetical protein